MREVPSSTTSALTSLHATVETDGYAFVRAATMRDLLQSAGSLDDWNAFSGSWHNLALDTYMADGGRYRRRRHAVFTVPATGAAIREPHQPHYQSTDYNPLHGGVERWFEPIVDEVARADSLQTVLRFCQTLFGELAPNTGSWHVEVHQFRIEARVGEVGRPTPEGLHRDGVDYVLVLLINRRNIASGVTGISDAAGQSLGSFTLTDPLDAAIVDDRRVAHGVTPVEAHVPGEAAFRDVLVVTFRRKGGGAPTGANSAT